MCLCHFIWAEIAAATRAVGKHLSLCRVWRWFDITNWEAHCTEKKLNFDNTHFFHSTLDKIRYLDLYTEFWMGPEMGEEWLEYTGSGWITTGRKMGGKRLNGHLDVTTFHLSFTTGTCLTHNMRVINQGTRTYGSTTLMDLCQLAVTICNGLSPHSQRINCNE